MPWAGLQYVIVVFPDHTHLLFVTMSVIILTLHYPIILSFSFVMKTILENMCQKEILTVDLETLSENKYI